MGKHRGVEGIIICDYSFALPFLQTVYFLQASKIMKRLAYARFSFES